MDNKAQGFAQKIVSELESIKRLIVDAISRPQQEHQSSQGNKGQSYKSENDTKLRIDSSTPKTEPSVASNHNATKKNESRFPRLTELEPVLELVGVVFLVIYATVTILMWCENGRANKIASDALSQSRFALERDLRPYVMVSKFDLLGDFLAGGAFQGQVGVVNTGHTPAIKLEGCADIVLRANTMPMTDDYACPSPDNPPARLHLLPASEHSIFALGPGLAPFDLRSPGMTINPIDELRPLLSKGALLLYLYGEITYSDMINPAKILHTKFCGRYNAEARSFDVCGKHNGVD